MHPCFSHSTNISNNSQIQADYIPQFIPISQIFIISMYDKINMDMYVTHKYLR